MTSASAPAFDDVFEAHIDYVCHSLRRLGVQERDVEDLAHEVFLVVHRRLGEYDPTRPIRAWIFGISLRVASAYRQLHRNRFEVVGSELSEAPSHTHDERIEARDVVLRALAAISIDMRAIVVMHDIDGQNVPDIAQTLGIPLNTAYSRLRLARLAFRAEVDRMLPNGGCQ